MSTSLVSKIDCGFIEPFAKQWQSKCKYFPSKVGGRPAFLVLKPVLGPEQLSCGKCQRTMRFILQIYAPIDTNSSAFHRTLFVFGCGATADCVDQFVVFRSQLARSNKFYNFDPPNYEEDCTEYDPSPEKFGSVICPVCGVAAPKRCSQCMKANYCSREHQVLHWKQGEHKKFCTGENLENTQPIEEDFSKYDKVVFPEFELIIGDNDDDDNNNDDDKDVEDDDEGSDSDDEKPKCEMEKYREYIQKNRPTMQNENMDQYGATEIDDDEKEQKVFENFRKMTNSGEVIRYRFEWYNTNEQVDDILWISGKNRLNPDTDVPNCENCGAKRKFEFQILPHLLSKILSENSTSEHLDWGTLLVFSCPNSCVQSSTTSDDGSSILDHYYPEFIYNQKII